MDQLPELPSPGTISTEPTVNMFSNETGSLSPEKTQQSWFSRQSEALLEKLWIPSHTAFHEESNSFKSGLEESFANLSVQNLTMFYQDIEAIGGGEGLRESLSMKTLDLLNSTTPAEAVINLAKLAFSREAAALSHAFFASFSIATTITLHHVDDVIRFGEVVKELIKQVLEESKTRLPEGANPMTIQKNGGGLNASHEE